MKLSHKNVIGKRISECKGPGFWTWLVIEGKSIQGINGWNGVTETEKQKEMRSEKQLKATSFQGLVSNCEELPFILKERISLESEWFIFVKNISGCSMVNGQVWMQREDLEAIKI